VVDIPSYLFSAKKKPGFWGWEAIAPGFGIPTNRGDRSCNI